MRLYHGTNVKNYKSILKNGFNKGTYFSQELDSAICYGGKYVFAVALDDIELMETQWEYISSTRISVDVIEYIQKFSLKLKYLNKKLLFDIDKNGLEAEGKEICLNCQGKGEHRKDKYSYRYLKKPGGGGWKTRKDRVIVCKTCNGYGYKI